MTMWGRGVPGRRTHRWKVLRLECAWVFQEQQGGRRGVGGGG